MFQIGNDMPDIRDLNTMLDSSLGHVRGRVIDMDGHGIANSRIWIRETGRSTYTDLHGNFILINLVPALYSVIAESEGYTQSLSVDIPVECGDNPGQLFMLYPVYNRVRLGRRKGAMAFQMA
jgi:hypothetical protein